MIKGIGFDLQFTIVYLEDFTLERWFRLFDAGFIKVMAYLTDLGITFEPDKLKRTLRRIRNRYFAITITEDQQYFTEETLKDTFAKSNITLDPENFENCVKLYHSVEIPAWKPALNAQNTLEELTKNYKLALITNASEYVTHQILTLQKMEDFFTFIFTKARKPRASAFLQFKEAMNTTFDELAMVGDDIHADIKPARELGMRTIHAYRGYEYLQHHAHLKIKPDKQVDKFEDILTAIDQLNA